MTDRKRERVTKPLPKEKRAEVFLTDEEREAIAWGIACVTRDVHAATLRKLLERTQ